MPNRAPHGRPHPGPKTSPRRPLHHGLRRLVHPRLQRRWQRRLARGLWRGLALVALVLGIVGIFVPGLPTAPFVLVSAWAAGRGWPALEQWLLNHARHGPAIRRWRERGAVPRRAKWLASISMAASAVIIGFTAAPLAVKLLAPAVMAAVALWLWRRPEL